MITGTTTTNSFCFCLCGRFSSFACVLQSILLQENNFLSTCVIQATLSNCWSWS